MVFRTASRVGVAEGERVGMADGERVGVAEGERVGVGKGTGAAGMVTLTRQGHSRLQLPAAEEGLLSSQSYPVYMGEVVLFSGAGVTGVMRV